VRRAGPLLVVLALVAAACGGGHHSEPRAPTDEPGRIGVDRLALMVLPQRVLGAPAVGLAIDRDASGRNDNAAAAASSIDPDDTAAALRRAGRITGYELDFVDSGLTTLTGDGGVYEVGTRVHLFRDRTSAHAFLAKQIGDFERLAGADSANGPSLRGVSTFPVARVGEEAWGVTASIAFGGIRTYGTFVAFRRGRLVGTAGLLRKNVEDDVTLVLGIARTLAERMEGVAAGRAEGLRAPLVEQPAPQPGPPPGEFDPAEMTLALADLPAGSSVLAEGYTAAAGTVATFHRVFDVDGASFAGVRLVRLESGASLFDRAFGADAALATIRSTFRPVARSVIGDAVGGAAARDVRVARLPNLGLGDDAVGFRSSFRSAGRRVDGWFVFVRVGRALGSVFAIAEGAGAARFDVGPLADSLAARLAAGFRG
jgi:hypothetical protein